MESTWTILQILLLQPNAFGLTKLLFYFGAVHTPVLYVLPLANQLFYSKDFSHEKMQHTKIATVDVNDPLFQYDLRNYGAAILRIFSFPFQEIDTFNFLR